MQWSKQKGEKDRQYNGQNKKEKRIDRTDNAMGKTKRRKGYTGQTMQCSKQKGEKDRQYNGLSILFSFLFCPLYCLSSLSLSPFCFDHRIFCPVYPFLLFVLTFVLSILFSFLF
jgi:hypothetical protein